MRFTLSLHHSCYALWNSGRVYTFLTVFKEDLNSSNWHTKQVVSEEKRTTWLIKYSISKCGPASTSIKAFTHTCHSIYFLSVNRTKRLFLHKRLLFESSFQTCRFRNQSVLILSVRVLSLILPANDLNLGVFLDRGVCFFVFCITLGTL